MLLQMCYCKIVKDPSVGYLMWKLLANDVLTYLTTSECVQMKCFSMYALICLYDEVNRKFPSQPSLSIPED